MTETAFTVREGRCPHCGTHKPLWTPAAMIAALQDWDRQHGRPPTYAEWNKAGPGHPTPEVIAGVFGGWSKAILAAGFARRYARRQQGRWWTRQRIIDAATDWYFAHGTWPTTHAWAHAGQDHPSTGSIYPIFGNWPAMLAAAGKRAA